MWCRGATIGVLLVAALVVANARLSDAQISPDVLQPAILRTVKLFSPVGETDQGAGCSGSFVSPSGVILTAAHCVRDPKTHELYNPDGAAIVFLDLPDRVNPVPLLIARRIVDNPGLDVALLRTVALLGEDRPKPLPSDFRVPYIALGDSDALRIGDPVAALGFPGLGGESITVTQGHVTGFDADSSNVKSWLKHDAATTHGHSGGPIINARGQQIAIVSHGRVDPSSAASVAHDALTNRIPLAWAQYLRGGPVSAQQPGPQQPGPQPPPAARPQAGAVVQGRVVDADSGAGIAGGLVVIFRPGTNLRAARESDVVASGQTDGNGAFRTNPPVPKGATYPSAALAKGYAPASGQLGISPNDPDVIRLKTIQLHEQ